ncbi:MAG: DMT family transporter [Sphingorhabdus sp.]
MSMNRPSALHPNPAIPFLVAAAALVFFSLMDVAMKSLSISMGAFNAVYWRNVIGALITGAAFLSMRLPWPKPDVLRIHMKRSIVVAVMAVCFFWALARLPLAEAIGLSFFAPVIALYLAAILLGENIGKEAIIASVAGIAGVGIIVGTKFSGEYEPEALQGTIAVMFSACLFAYNLILAREQAQQAKPLEIAFFQNLLTAAVLSLAAPWFLDGLAVTQVPLLSAAALLAVISVLLLSWAYARAEAQILIPVEYTGFIWAAIFGWYFFAEAVTWATIFGTALIVAGSLVAARARPKLASAAEIG